MAIKVNAILDENGFYSPVEIPLNYGCYFDEKFFYFFENKEEADLWLKEHNINEI